MRGFDLCATHSGSTPSAPKGYLRGLKHGFYARPEAVGYREEAGTRGSIDGKIALLAARRDALERWLTEKVAAGEDVDVLKYTEMILRATWKGIRMTRLREAIAADSNRIAELFERLADEESEKRRPEA